MRMDHIEDAPVEAMVNAPLNCRASYAIAGQLRAFVKICKRERRKSIDYSSISQENCIKYCTSIYLQDSSFRKTTPSTSSS